MAELVGSLIIEPDRVCLDAPFCVVATRLSAANRVRKDAPSAGVGPKRPPRFHLLAWQRATSFASGRYSDWTFENAFTVAAPSTIHTWFPVGLTPAHGKIRMHVSAFWDICPNFKSVAEMWRHDTGEVRQN